MYVFIEEKSEHMGSNAAMKLIRGNEKLAVSTRFLEGKGSDPWSDALSVPTAEPNCIAMH
jgi:hypothetical protein